MQKLIQLTILICIFTNNSQAQTPAMYGVQMTSPGATDYFTFETFNPQSCSPSIISSNLQTPMFGSFVTGIAGSCSDLFYPGRNQNNNKGVLRYSLGNGQPTFTLINSQYPNTKPSEFEYNLVNDKLISFSCNSQLNHLYYSYIDANSGNETILFEISDTVITGNNSWSSGSQFNNHMTLDQQNNIIYHLFNYDLLTKYDINNGTFQKINAQQYNASLHFLYNIFFDSDDNAIYGIGYNPSSTVGLLKLDLTTNQFSLVTEILEDLSDLNYVTYSDEYNLFTLSMGTTTDANYTITYDLNNNTQNTCNYGELNPPMVYIDCEIAETQVKGENQILSIAPNPVKDILFIKNSSNEEMQFVLSDLNGKELLNEKNITQIDLEHFEQGVYFLEINSKTFNCIKKVIKD